MWIPAQCDLREIGTEAVDPPIRRGSAAGPLRPCILGRMRIVQWHGWLLEGSGSNVYTARVTEQFRGGGHDVVLLCQERHPHRYSFIDAVGSVSKEGISGLTETGAPPGPGRVTLLRPEIGRLLPVFVLDEYEGFEVKRFVDLSDAELDSYLARNVEALRVVLDQQPADAVTAGHAVPGAV